MLKMKNLKKKQKDLFNKVNKLKKKYTKGKSELKKN